jgi:hypothetical protein
VRQYPRLPFKLCGCKVGRCPSNNDEVSRESHLQKSHNPRKLIHIISLSFIYFFLMALSPFHLWNKHLKEHKKKEKKKKD